jgi:hypothetical protein
VGMLRCRRGKETFKVCGLPSRGFFLTVRCNIFRGVLLSLGRKFLMSAEFDIGEVEDAV